VSIDIVPIYLRVPRHEIAYVKFVIESYEGIAVTRTLDRHAATVVVLAAPDLVDDARRIIAALEGEGACHEIAWPAGADVDVLGPRPDYPDDATPEEAP
jgi:hypothetical protein